MIWCKPWYACAMVVLMTGSPASGRSDAIPLDGAAIRQAMIGKAVRYSPPGSADAGVREEFHADGTWRGVRLGRGPIPFSGRWTIAKGSLCVTADRGSPAERWLTGRYCRTVWRSATTGQLRMDHLVHRPASVPATGRQILSVEVLPASR